MGRRPSYEIDDVFRASVTLFRAQGFHQVSVPDLLSATGLNRFALYEKFGGKEGLFYDTLDYYHRVIVRDQLLGPLYRERASVGSVIRMLQMLRRINRDPKSRPGCLIMNANIELGGQDERVAEAVEFVVRTFREAVAHALTRAEQRGELRGPKPAKELAARTALSIQRSSRSPTSRARRPTSCSSTSSRRSAPGRRTRRRQRRLASGRRWPSPDPRMADEQTGPVPGCAGFVSCAANS